MYRRTKECIIRWEQLARYRYEGPGKSKQPLIKYHPDEIMERDFTESGKATYSLLLNKKRVNRLRKGIVMRCSEEELCEFEQKIIREVLIKDPSRYGPYTVCSNMYPINFGHSVIIHGQSPGKPQNNIGEDDLRYMINIALDTGYNIIHNSLPEGEKIGTGATVDHLHFQGYFPIFHTSNLEKKALAKASTNGNRLEAGSMMNYPAANIVFKGKESAKNAAELIKKLNGLSIARTTAIIKKEIYIFPRKKETPSHIMQKAGGIEIAGNRFIICDVKDEAGNILVEGEELFEKLTINNLEDAQRETVYSDDELKTLCGKDLLGIYLEGR